MFNWENTISKILSELNISGKKEKEKTVRDKKGSKGSERFGGYHSLSRQAVEEINSFARETATNRFHEEEEANRERWKAVVLNKQAKDEQDVKHHVKDEDKKKKKKKN